MSATAHQERLMTVLQGPHLSEKSHLAAERNQVVFNNISGVKDGPI